jgi:hypothetical protein
MRRVITSIVVLMIAVTLLQGQIWKTQRIELSAGFGPTQFFGDIGGFTPTENVLGLKDIQLKQTRFNIGLGANYRVNLRLNFSSGMFSSDDARGSNADRGFKSTTVFFEPLLAGEYYLIKNHAEESFLFSRKRTMRNRPRKLDGPVFQNTLLAKMDLYLFTGIGGIGYRVKVNDALGDRDLKKKGFAMVIPAGVGFKYMYSPEISAGIEFGGRYAFSDYLEGYTSSYSKYNDIYYFLNATFTYKFDTANRRIWGMR